MNRIGRFILFCFYLFVSFFFSFPLSFLSRTRAQTYIQQCTRKTMATLNRRAPGRVHAARDGGRVSGGEGEEWAKGGRRMEGKNPRGSTYRPPLSRDSVFKRPYGAARHLEINGGRSNRTSMVDARRAARRPGRICRGVPRVCFGSRPPPRRAVRPSREAGACSSGAGKKKLKKNYYKLVIS